MTSHFVHSTFLVLLGLSSLCLSYEILRRSRMSAAIASSMSLFACTLICFSNIFQKDFRNLPLSLFWIYLEYIGWQILPIAWLVMSLDVSGYRHLLTNRLVRLLAVEPVIYLFLVFTNPWHELVMRNVHVNDVLGLIRPVYTYGPAFIGNAAYSYILLFIGLGFFGIAVATQRHIYRWQALAMIASVLSPLIVNSLHLLGFRPFAFDASPMSLGISVVVLAFNVCFLNAFAVAPIAREILIRGMRDGVLVFDDFGTIVEINESASQLLRIGVDQIGKSIQEALADWPDLVSWLDVPGAEPFIYEEARGGQFVYHEFSTTPLFSSGRQHVGHMLLVRDVTNLKQTQRRLERLERERRDALRLAEVGHWDWDLRSKVLTGSTEFYQVMGLPPRPCSIEEFQAPIHPEDCGQVASVIARLLNSGTSVIVNYRYRRPADGREIYVEGRGESIVDLAGKPTTAFGTVQDITDRRRREHLAVESEQLYRNLLNQATDAILVSDSHQRFIEVNPSACQLLGYSHDELLQMSITDVIDPQNLRELPLKFNELNEGKSLIFPRVLRHRDGHKIEVETASKKLSDGRYLAFVRDLSVRKKAEAERRELDERVQSTQKFESLGMLAAGLAHDFNNLLVGVLGNANLAHLELPEASPAQRFIDRIEMSAIRAAELCQQMLAYAGRGAVREESIQLSRLVREMFELLEVTVSKRSGLKLNLANELPPIRGDATQIRQVVMNLITNASEAVDTSVGMIEISTGTKEAVEALASAAFVSSTAPADHYVYLRVKDNGLGMSKEVLNRVFDPFFTTKVTGRGLGLAAVLGIIRSHQGLVRVESRPRQGTEFVVYFPVEEKSASVASKSVVTIDEGELDTVLVIDDEPMVAQFASETLRRHRYGVQLAGNIEEALEELEHHPGRIGVILLDAMIADHDAPNILMEMRRLAPRAAVVVSSGFVEKDALDRLELPAGTPFLHKPYRLSDLLRTIERAFSRLRDHSPTASKE